MVGTSIHLKNIKHLLTDIDENSITIGEEFGSHVTIFLTPAQAIKLAQEIIETHHRLDQEQEYIAELEKAVEEVA